MKRTETGWRSGDLRGARIERLDIYRVRLPFKTMRVASNAHDAAFNAASTAYTQMESLYVRVTLDDGRSGWGEAFGHAGNDAAKAALVGAAGRFFIGLSVESPAAIHAAARRAFHSYGQTGAFVYALSAVDTALWDLAAQQAGMPLYRMLGGTGNGAVRRYASLVSYGNDPHQVADEVMRAYEAGFRSIKLHETTYAAVASARGALPSDASLMVDVNCAWTEEEAETVLASWRELELDFVEEPLWPVDDYDALARLRRLGVPIAAGENVAGAMGGRSLVSKKSVDFFQPSVAKIGGITAAMESIDHAMSNGVDVLPHCFYYGPGLLATAHIVASLGSETYLETPYLQFGASMHEAMLAAPTLALPVAPGLGFHPDSEIVERYLVERAIVE